MLEIFTEINSCFLKNGNTFLLCTTNEHSPNIVKHSTYRIFDTSFIFIYFNDIHAYYPILTFTQIIIRTILIPATSYTRTIPHSLHVTDGIIYMCANQNTYIHIATTEITDFAKKPLHCVSPYLEHVYTSHLPGTQKTVVQDS